MKEIIFLNGNFIPDEEAKISALSPGFLYGYGLFETMRSCQGKIVYWEQHLKRLRLSCGLLGISLPYSGDKLKAIIRKAIRLNACRDNSIRLTLWKEDFRISQRNTGLLMIIKRYQPYSDEKYAQGFRACISRFRQNEYSVLASLKTTNRILYEMAFKEAKLQNLDEAIMLNSRGIIAEASRSNIFFVKDSELFTPSLECGCLQGITRQVIFDLADKHKISLYEGSFIPQDLLKAEEAFLTNSLLGVMPLACVENRTLGKGRCGKLTKFFIKKYNYLS